VEAEGASIRALRDGTKQAGTWLPIVSATHLLEELTQKGQLELVFGPIGELLGLDDGLEAQHADSRILHLEKPGSLDDVFVARFEKRPTPDLT
jgi:hypothetical protein